MSVANFTIFETYYYVSPSLLKTKQVQFFQSFHKGHYCNSSLNTLSWSKSVWSRVTETLHYLRPYTEYCRATSLSHTPILFIQDDCKTPGFSQNCHNCVHFVIQPAAYLQNCYPAKCFSYLNLLLLPKGIILCFSLLSCIPYTSGHSSSFPRLFHTLMLVFPPRLVLSRQLVNLLCSITQATKWKNKQE